MEYKTKDLAESAALIATGHKLTRINREERICFFIFENGKECKDVSDKYFFGKLLVNARDFYEAMNLLKNRIFQ